MRTGDNQDRRGLDERAFRITQAIQTTSVMAPATRATNRMAAARSANAWARELAA